MKKLSLITHLIKLEQEPVVKELRPSDREPWYWYGDPELVIEKQPEEVKLEEPVYEFKGERASNFEPEHWYHLAKIDSERRASDEEPKYWYKRNEVKKHPNVKRMGAPIPEPIEDAGFDVEPLSPVQPIKKDEATPLP